MAGTVSTPVGNERGHKCGATRAKSLHARGKGGSDCDQTTSRGGVLMLPDTIERAVRSLPTIIRSGRRVNGLFRLMKSPLLWEHAYQQIAPNKGAIC